MNFNHLQSIVLVIIATLVSGIGDGQGFIHGSGTWTNGRFVFSEFLKSLFSFLIGALGFIFAVKYMQQVSVFAVEIQTIIWFSVTIIGVALVGGKFITWQIIDQIVALVVLLGIGWLIFHAGG